MLKVSRFGGSLAALATTLIVTFILIVPSILVLAAFAREALRPTLVRADTARAAIAVQFPGIPGVVPGVGRFDPCDWGLGWELHDGKSPHWMGADNSSATFGHFGGAGTFVWVDPVADVACVGLTDRDFDDWAKDAWPPFADEVLRTIRG